MNVFNGIGRVGKDAKIKFTSDQKPIASWSLAIQSGYGEKAVTTWLNCSLFGNRAESLANYIKKGSQLGVSGEIRLREYADKQGVNKSSLELLVNSVSLLGNKDDKPREAKEPEKANGYAPESSSFDDMADNIQF